MTIYGNSGRVLVPCLLSEPRVWPFLKSVLLGPPVHHRQLLAQWQESQQVSRPDSTALPT